MMKRILSIVLFFVSVWAHAQYYSSGEPPFSLKWKQINTDRFQIIFPSSYEVQAQVFANKLDYAYRTIGYSLKNEETKKVTIIIHNEPAFANGMVAWAPSRMELYATPHQEIYGEDWMEQLIVHESRHFVQIDKLNQGFTKLLSYLFGEQGTAVTLGLFVPPWYMEGDAVATETLLTNAGRGRRPDFEQGVRALTLSLGKQKYDRALLGSYNYMIPSKYNFGYQIVTANRYLSQSNIFEQKLDYIGSSFSPITFFSNAQNALRNRGKLKYYDRAFEYLQDAWTEQDRKLYKSEFLPLSDISDLYVNYNLLTSDGENLYAEKSTFSHVPYFVLLDSVGKEHVEIQRGYRSSGQLAARNSILTWEEPKPDSRYGLRSYSVVKTYNTKTQKLHTLKKKTRWYAPSFSPRGNRIALIQEEVDNTCYLKIVDASSGLELWSFSKKDTYLQQPFWIDEQHLGVIFNSDAGQSLVEIDILTRDLNILVPFSHHVMLHPIAFRGDVYFTGSWSGINNIYKYTSATKALNQITSSQFGADHVAITNRGIYYLDYTYKGYRVVKLEGEFLKPASTIVNGALNLQDSILNQEERVLNFSDAGNKNYTVKNYSKLNLLRFHSWGIFALSADNQYGIHPGVSLMSQNKLNTSFLTLGYDASPSNSSDKYFMKYTYKGMWPILDLSIKKGSRPVDFNYDTQQSNGMYNYYAKTQVDVMKVDATVTLPFTFSSGAWLRKFSAFGRIIQEWDSPFDYQVTNATTSQYANFTQSQQRFTQLQYGATLYNLQQTSLRQLQPRWGQRLFATYKRNVGNQGGRIYGIEGAAYLPGAMLNHGVLLSVGYENSNNVYFDNVIHIPRGYSHIAGKDLWVMRANYNLPLCYPDWSMGAVLYLKRLSTNLFYDASLSSHFTQGKQWMNSSGVELLGDFNFLRYEQTVQLGIRSGWLSSNQKPFSEFLFSIQF